MPRNRDDRPAGTPERRGDPYGSGFRDRQRGRSGERPWVGGYRQGYQGGSGGIPVGGRGGADPYGPERGEDRRVSGGRDTGYDREWGTRQSDEAFRRFNRATRPRYSPIGGMHPAMGGEFVHGGGYHRGAGYDGWYGRRTALVLTAFQPPRQPRGAAILGAILRRSYSPSQ